jgi:hypothetical protein
VTEQQTCNQGQTDPMSIVDLDAATGTPLWQIEAQGFYNGNTLTYCFLEEPQMAIRPDGAVVISAIGSTAGLGHEFLIADGQTGALISSPPIPLSTITDPSGSVAYVYSVIGPRIVVPVDAPSRKPPVLTGWLLAV